MGVKNSAQSPEHFGKYSYGHLWGYKIHSLEGRPLLLTSFQVLFRKNQLYFSVGNLHYFGLLQLFLGGTLFFPLLSKDFYPKEIFRMRIEAIFPLIISATVFNKIHHNLQKLHKEVIRTYDSLVFLEL